MAYPQPDTISGPLGSVSIPYPPLDKFDLNLDTILHYLSGNQATPNYPFNIDLLLPSKVAIHTFLDGDLKREQRFSQGTGAREWKWRQELDADEFAALRQFWEDRNGSTRLFFFTAPKADGSNEKVIVRFASEPLGFEHASGLIANVNFHLIEVNLGVDPISLAPSNTPGSDNSTYPINDQKTRYTLQDRGGGGADLDLTNQVNTLIPLVTILPKDGFGPIHLSDRRVNVGGKQYLPRLLGWTGIGQTAIGLPNVDGASDDVTFTFGNADRIMTRIADATQLEYAVVQFSIYFVEAGVLLNFWAGEVTPGGWQSSASPEFKLQCSDPLSSPFLVCPPRTISHTCDAAFNNGRECPFASQSTGLDTAHYLAVNPSICDHGYDTPNGCLAHGMKYWFRGIAVDSQGVNVRDNSTGFLGIGRQTVSSFAFINDAAWGAALPIIVTDIELVGSQILPTNPAADISATPIVKGLILAGRDDGDFFEILAAVAEGPIQIGQRTSLDGQYHSGYPTPADYDILAGPDGISSGTTPSGGGAFVSLQQDGDQTENPVNTQVAPDWRWKWVPDSAAPNDHTRGFTAEDNYSAGCAFVWIRRDDAKGIQLQTLDQHQVLVDVISGWTGWTWSSPGSRNGASPNGDINLTNPIWLAINVYLHCLRLKDFATTAEQEAMFDVDAAVKAAAIADLVVDRVVEANQGQEFQWRFIGQITQQRPLRDWLNDILLNCLGYYTFANGKLVVGIRHMDPSQNNIGIRSAFTDGNIVYRSLTSGGIAPQFTKALAAFNDAEYNWSPNTASFQDDDYARELGGGNLALHRTANFTLTGTADISQAARFVITRGREEVGGITAQERHAARRGTFKSTVLALDCGPGDAISITDPEFSGQGGTILARVEKFVLNQDWSVDITWRSLTVSMYDLSIGPQPSDKRPGPLNPEFFPFPLEPVWLPNQESPSGSNPVSDSDNRSFSIQQNYVSLDDGSVGAVVDSTGQLPIDVFEPGVTPSIIRNSFAIDSSGGNLPEGHSYWIGIAPWLNDKTTGKMTYGPLSNIIPVHIAAGSGPSNTIKLTVVIAAAPSGQNWEAISLFVGLDDSRRMCWQTDLDPNAVMPSGQTSGSIDVTGYLPGLPLKRGTFNPPTPAYKQAEIKVKYLIHSGPVGVQVTEVGAGFIRCGGIATLSDDWSGRIVSIIARSLDKDGNPQNTPILDFMCKTYDSTTGTFYVTPDPNAADSNGNMVLVDDALVVRFIADTITDAAKSDAVTSIGDSKIMNGTYPAGEKVDGQKGNLIRLVDRVLNRTQIRTIISNTATVYTVDRPWDWTPDNTTWWIVEGPNWTFNAHTSDISNAQIGIATTIRAIVSNYVMQPVLVGAFMIDRDSGETPDNLVVFRETWIFGEPGAFGTPNVTFIHGAGPIPQDIGVGHLTTEKIVARGKGGTLYGWDAKLDSPSNGEVVVDFLLNGVSIFDPAKRVVIPVGTASDVVVAGTAFNGTVVVKAGDRLRSKVIQTGTIPGKGFTANLYWK